MMTSGIETVTSPYGRHDENAQMWAQERPEGYNQLAWVKATSITQPFLELAPAGGLHVDMGTGTGAILTTLADTQAVSIGVDASQEMLSRVPEAKPGNTQYLIRADATEGLPFADASVDVVTERMMLHDLDEPKKAIQEGYRILKPRGKLIACEYVVDRPGVLAIAQLDSFEKRGDAEVSPLMPSSAYKNPSEDVVDLLGGLFALKHEPDRFLWEGNEFADLISEACPDADVELQLSLEYHSVANWLEKSGFPIEECKQPGIMLCLEASSQLKREFGLHFTRHGLELPEDFHKAVLHAYRNASSAEREAMGLDVRFYAAFAFVTATKPAE